jgi:hypothetical protein
MICESTLTVHSSAHKSSPPVGKVTVLNSSVTDLTTFKNRGSVSGSGSIASQTKFTINEASAYSFDFDRYGRGVKESFEWVQDISDEVRTTHKISPKQSLTHMIPRSRLRHFPNLTSARKIMHSLTMGGNSSAHLTTLYMQFTYADKITRV